MYESLGDNPSSTHPLKHCRIFFQNEVSQSLTSFREPCCRSLNVFEKYAQTWILNQEDIKNYAFGKKLRHDMLLGSTQAACCFYWAQGVHAPCLEQLCSTHTIFRAIKHLESRYATF